jgi:sigma-B regulation protein RsbU (phosphoserine phosphatase)
MFVTLFYGVLDISAKDLTYVNAGHELPLLFGEDRRMCMKLSTTGTALGILPTYNFTSDRIEFVPGDVLLLYTDGAVDARRDRKFLGVEGVETMFCNVVNQDAHGIVDELDRGIREYASGVLHDDVALMVVKYRRRAGPVERITAATQETD